MEYLSLSDNLKFIAARRGAEIEQLTVDGLLKRRSSRDEGTANGVLLQFTANRSASRLAGRSMAGMRIHDLRKKTGDGNENVANDGKEDQKSQKAKQKPEHKLTAGMPSCQRGIGRIALFLLALLLGVRIFVLRSHRTFNRGQRTFGGLGKGAGWLQFQIL